MNDRPIGVLDSGVGGLTVWKEILRELPHESTIYIGDSRNAPYGDKTQEEIFLLARHLIKFLLRKHVKLIVIACNVITTNSLDRLRNEFKNVPIVGTVPVVKMATEKTKKKKIGILSTNGTAKSHYQKHLIEQFASGVVVFNFGTNVLVPLVEEGKVEGLEIEKALKLVLRPFKNAGVDVVVLGCTHFPFLREPMQQLLGKHVLLLDSGAAIARQVKRILEKNNTQSKKKQAVHTMYTTGDIAIFSAIFVAAKLPEATRKQVILD